MKIHTAESFRNEALDKKLSHLKEYLIERYSISEAQLQIIQNYLARRGKEVRGQESFGIVFVLTNKCNLNCLHCGVNAKLARLSKGSLTDELSFKEAATVIDKVADYTKIKGYRPFLMFGGGEPSLLKEFPEIVRYASERLGSENVGFCSNGTTMAVEDLLELSTYVGLIETSIDGLEEDHNAMRDPRGLTRLDNPFLMTHDLVKAALDYPELKEILEVSAIATKKNWKSLPSLARRLRGEGLKQFSIHRAIPVGRMKINAKYILSKEDYLNFFMEMALVKEEESDFAFHIHHSLESIYSTLFLGKDVHHSDLPMGSGRHSIGIDWQGTVFFDAWSLVSPFELLKSYNLINEDVSLFDVLDSPESLVGIVNDLTKRDLRCKQCKLPCSGGMRINALFNYVSRVQKGRITDSHLLAGLSEIDPACLISSE